MAGKKATQIDKNRVEAIRNDSYEIGNIKDIPKYIANEGKQFGGGFLEQLLGINGFKTSGEMTEGQPVDFKAQKTDTSKVEEQQKAAEFAQRAEKRKSIDVGIDYRSEIIHGEKRITRNEQQELAQKIDQLLSELKQLAKSSKSLEVEFKAVVVEQRPVAIGKYHVNFFEWMLSVVRAARIKVEESGSWLSAMSGKKAKKDYWGMSKKHGTSFSLSGERVVSQQTG